MNDSPENFLRVIIDNADIREFDLPRMLRGHQVIFTARKREGQFIDVSIQGGRFSFDHPAMKNMLQRLENPEGGRVNDIVIESLEAVHDTMTGNVTP
ncbi:MAG: hypothetical protein Q7S29_02920 [Candidatus Peribacter sp.]|nr:hypothetical protein [Candidatus Peribacter sp.]